MWMEVLPTICGRTVAKCLKPSPHPALIANNGIKCTKNEQNERKKPKKIVKKSCVYFTLAKNGLNCGSFWPSWAVGIVGLA